MFWNHRVVDRSKENDGDTWLEIQEVYYNESGEPCSYCDPCVGGESIEELQIQIQRFAECLSQPILNAEKDFTGSLYDGDEVEDGDI